MNKQEIIAILESYKALEDQRTEDMLHHGYDNTEESKKRKAALDQAIEAIRNPKPEWIPCEDQTPENDDEDRIVITSGGNTAIVTNYNNGFNCTSFSREHEIKGVKAWFYLPENFGEYEGGRE